MKMKGNISGQAARARQWGVGGKRQRHEIYSHTVTKSNGFTRRARRTLVPLLYKYQAGCNPITLKHLVVIGVMKHTAVSINPSMCVHVHVHTYVHLRLIDLQQITVMRLNMSVEQILMTSVV